MKTNNYISSANPFLMAFAIAVLFSVTSCMDGFSQSGDVTVSGVVRFVEDNAAAPGVNIYLKGATSRGTYTDGQGKFEFPGGLREGDVLIFSFIGRETIEHVVNAQMSEPLQIIMNPDSIEIVECPLVEGDPKRSVLSRVIRKARNVQ